MNYAVKIKKNAQKSNVGVHGMVTKFPRMKKAIEKADWITAAKESNRPRASKARNDLVRRWFNEAAKRK